MIQTVKSLRAICLVLTLPICILAQAAPNSNSTATLPAAPEPQETTRPNLSTSGQVPQPAMGALAVPGTPTPLSLQDAQALALKHNPQISVARLNALASQQVTREARSNLWPDAHIDLTAVDANPGSRITAGALNNPTVYQRAAAGTMVTQLITDFGRTTNLIASANLAAKAENQNQIATKEQILLAVDQAFYSSLQSQAVLTVAQETVKARQTVSDQVNSLFQSKLKSGLDLSFANVNLAQAKLLLLDAQNNENSSFAALSAVLGYSNLQNFQLVEDTTPNVAPPENVDELIATAFNVRPEILALEFQSEAAQKFQKAERDLLFPDVRALAAVGDTPVRNPIISPNWYGAVGVNVDIPVFNGFL